MEPIIKTGPTVDSAIQAALEELGLSRDDVQVDILQIESSGILGIFGRKGGKVRVTPIRKETGASAGPQPADQGIASSPASPVAAGEAGGEPRPTASKEPIPDGELVPFAQEIIGKVAECFGIRVRVEGTETDNAISLRVVGEGVGQLIGRRGKTLGAVQYMVSRLINEDRSNKKKVVIDVDGYNEDREQSLKDLAVRTGERVAGTGKPVCLRPMPPQERRVIHLTLQDDERVSTESFGSEGRRAVVVYPKSMSPADLKRYLSQEDSGGNRKSSNHRGRRRRGGNGRRR